MSQNPVIRIHLLKIRLYRIFTSLESSLQICFAITYYSIKYNMTVSANGTKLKKESRKSFSVPIEHPQPFINGCSMGIRKRFLSGFFFTLPGRLFILRHRNYGCPDFRGSSFWNSGLRNLWSYCFHGYSSYHSSGCSFPVSYTHLDVYKRQALSKNGLLCM